MYLKQYKYLSFFLILFVFFQEFLFSDSTNTNNDEISFEEFQGIDNRFPLILSDAKSFFSESIIADHHGDSLEVLFLLDKIIELLNAAEELGDMTEDDQIEFNRFEKTLIHSYQNNFNTVDKTSAPIATASLKEELSKYLTPIEIEINGSSFKVIDDREGHIPLVINPRVERAISYFQNRARDSFEKWLTRYPYYYPMIKEILDSHELPEELIYHSMVESGLNPRAYSRAKAVGMWQFIFSTAKIYGLDRDWWVDERRDPEKATNAAAKYLKDLYLEFDDWYLALAAYNAGAGRINRAIRIHQTRDFWALNTLPKETKNHVPTVLATAIIAKNPKKYGFDIPKNDKIYNFDKVEVKNSTDLNVLAKCAGISVDELRQYNPELRQHATPSGKSYFLKIPSGLKNEFLNSYNLLDDRQRFAPEYMIHVVKSGHNLSWIADKYGVKIHQIASFNKIKNYNRLSIGQKLTIPISGNLLNSRNLAQNKEKNSVVYTVRSGDTLGHIAMRFSSTARKIRQLNGLSYGSVIYPNQKLKVPINNKLNLTENPTNTVKEIYTVKSGDTLSHISERYRVGMSKIRKWNGISHSDLIIPGQKLVIYVKQG